MSSQLSIQDKDRILKGITKKVGDKPYENGYWGTDVVRDFLCVELYDDLGTLIEYRNVSLADSLVEIDENYVKLKPGLHIQAFGYKTGKFKIRYKFLRNLGGSDNPVLLKTTPGAEGEIFQPNDDASNIFVNNDGKIYVGTEEIFLNNQADGQRPPLLQLTNYKYDVDKISSSRTEIRLKAKDIRSSYVGDIDPSLTSDPNQLGKQYIEDFLKLQEGVKVETIENTPAVFLGVEEVDMTNASAFNPPTTVIAFNESKTIQITPNTGGFIFTPNMVGGSITIEDFFNVGSLTREKRTNQNIFTNPNLEEIVMSEEFGTPATVDAAWDTSLHNMAVNVVGWTSGFNTFGTSSPWNGSHTVGYHAHFVQNEGNQGGTCLKFIDQNNIFDVYSWWPGPIEESLGNHRPMTVKQEMLDLSALGASSGDILNISFDMKSTVIGKGVEVQLIYPLGVENEPAPSGPPLGFFDPSNPAPTEPIPTSPPDGYLASTNGNATTLESSPPPSQPAIIQAYGLTNYDGQVGDTSADLPGSIVQSNGEGLWKITNIAQSQPFPVYTWGANLGSDYNQEGALAGEDQWRWDGTAWVPNLSALTPTPPPGVVSLEEYPNAVNTHPYQQPGQGTAIFGRPTAPGENAGWQAATWLGSNRVMLIKDDMVWRCRVNYSGNLNDYQVNPITEIFPAIAEYVFPDDTEEAGKTLYEDIFANGFIQSVGRTRQTDNTTHDNVFIFWYCDGSGNTRQNKMFMVKAGESNLSDGIYDSNEGVRYWEDLDEGFNELLNQYGNKLCTIQRRNTGNDKWSYYYIIPGYDYWWRQSDGDSNHYEKVGGDGNFFDSDTPKNWGVGGEAGGFEDMPPSIMLIDGFGFNMGSQGATWSNYDILANIDANAFTGLGVTESGLYWCHNDSNGKFVSADPIAQWAYKAGELGDGGIPLTYGVRNPGAINFGTFNDDGTINSAQEPIYDNGQAEFDFPSGTDMAGTVSPGGQWQWSGNLDTGWTTLTGATSFNYNSAVTEVVYSTVAGQWNKYEIEIEVPNDWNQLGAWFIAINGHNAFNDQTGDGYGIVWLDNFFGDFTLTQQTEVVPIKEPFTATITSVMADGTMIELNRSILSVAGTLSEQNPNVIELLDNNQQPEFTKFQISYLVYNPYDLRTYLKFGNKMFLTTNFKKDTSSSNYPFSLVYKLYQPLPQSIRRMSECSIVKEMMNPILENVNIVEFIDNDVPDIVLKSPDIMNVESPIQLKSTDYKNQNDILSTDTFISQELQNEFLSQSLDSVELNVDYSRYENFINFSSVEKRIRNFKHKLELIEAHKQISASYVGVSGSLQDLNIQHNNIKEIKNGLDGFEKYMYFQSSSYISSSIGQFFDNAWPKTSGTGEVNNQYVLAHTTSSQAESWFSNAITSSSLYDNENLNKLSSLLPTHVKIDANNETYLNMTDMIGHHFDNIWIYIKAMGDTFDRREKLSEGISRDLLYEVGKSLGWNLNDGKDRVSLARYALGKEVTGSAGYSDYSSISERDASREIWSRIINNMPFLLKHKGTIRSLRALIGLYGIPQTILRVKEYGGPDLPDDASPQFEISRKFTKALDFRSSQYVKTIWSDDVSSGRKPDTIEFRFKSPTGSNQILIEKKSTETNNVSSSFYVRLKDNNSIDDYGHVAFQISGSDGLKEISSSNLPIYDNEFYSVMVRRISGSDNRNVSQSFELSVGKYDASRSKIHLYSTSTMVTDIEASSSYNQNWENDGEIYIGGYANNSLVGTRFSGSMMEYRHWTEVLNTGSFKNHIANPKAYDGNTVSSSYSNLVLRYSFDDNMDLATDTDGIRDVSANQTTTYSGSHDGFTGNFFSNVVDETKSNIPSIGGLRRVTNKVRIEENKIKPGFNLHVDNRATVSAYDTAPNDSNKVGVFFAPTDVINNDIIESVANLNFDNYLGDPRDLQERNYRGLKGISDKYWQKYTSPNNFWDYIRIIKYYDQSIFPQLRKMIPARAKANLGILVEPNIFERPKELLSRKPKFSEHHYSASLDVSTDFIIITGSYNHGVHPVDSYTAYDARIDMFSYETGSSVISASGAVPLFTSSITEIADREAQGSVWRQIAEQSTTLSAHGGIYSNVTMSFGDLKPTEFFMPVVSGSRIRGNNQKLSKFYNSYSQSAVGDFHSSSLHYVDIDNLAFESQAFTNLYYEGCKQTKKTTTDKLPPVQIIKVAPTKLVKKETGDSTLDTGQGLVSKFRKTKKKKKGGFSKEIAQVAKSKDDAIEKAQEIKGDFLTLKETEKVISDFEKESKTSEKGSSVVNKDGTVTDNQKDFSLQTKSGGLDKTDTKADKSLGDGSKSNPSKTDMNDNENK